MQKYSNSYAGRGGQPIAGASVLVKNLDGTAATIYSDNGKTVLTGLVTAKDGSFAFYAANGHYTVTLSKTGLQDVTISDVLLFDPADSGASSFGFTQAGTGAVTRNVQDKLRDIVSVKDFGAVGDGTADDTAAIQDAIDFIQSRPYGGDVFMPAGKYKLTSAIKAVCGKYLRLHGEGKATKLFEAIAFGSAILAGSTASAANGSVFEDFMILGASSGTSDGITFTAANAFQINRVWFEAQGVAITLTSSYAVELNGCVFDVTASEAIKATTSAHNLIVRACNLYTCGVTSSKAAINLSAGSNNVVLDDNDFENCYFAASLQDCTSVSIKGNYIEYCDVSDIQFLGTCQGVEMNGNWIALGAIPFVLSNVTGMDFMYNTVSNHTVNVGSAVSQLHAAHNPTIGSGTVNINYLRFESRASSGGTPSLRANGSDTDVQLRMSSKGAGDVAVYTNNESNLSLSIGHVASAVNWARHVPSAAGQPLEVISQGASADIDYMITPKGAGRVRFGALTASADAPITGYIEIKDSSGIVRKLAVIS